MDQQRGVEPAGDDHVVNDATTPLQVVELGDGDAAGGDLSDAKVFHLDVEDDDDVLLEPALPLPRRFDAHLAR